MKLDWSNLPSADLDSQAAVRERADSVLRPGGALARLDEIAVWLAGWQRTVEPSVDRPAVILFAGDHGVASAGVSAYPQSVTAAMYEAIDKGVATSSAMARELGVDLVLVDSGVGSPTSDIRFEPAMSEAEFLERFEQGRAAVASLDVDLLVLGEMGIGNTTSAAAVTSALTSASVELTVGTGTGVSGSSLEIKKRVVAEALQRTGPVGPMEALRHLGGSEMAGMAGAAYEARLRSIPVLVDGYVVSASIAPLEFDCAGALDHCWPAHLSAEPGHRLLVERLGRRPILDLDMRLGEGSGALVALPLVRLAAAAVVNVATFEEWGLS